MCSIKEALSAYLLAACSGCCVMGGQYKLIEGVVDMKTEQASLPVKLIKTSGSFNVHSLECGQIKTDSTPPKQLGFVSVPLAFCKAESRYLTDWRWEDFSFAINGRAEKFHGYCYLDPNNATYVIKLESK